ATETITLDLIPDVIAEQSRDDMECPLLVNSSLDEVEKNHVFRVLNSTGWHKGEACRILGVSRPRLRRIIKQYGLVDPNGSGFEETEDDEIVAVGC
ncbi:MAG: hypothetical protein GY794_06755, partial [bacterium]|nr:hypothetical protein [bacterium]